MTIKFNQSFSDAYILEAPLALALERSVECQLFAVKQLPAPILDLGCGDGIFAKILFNGEVDTGVDLDPVEINKARQTGRYRELICCSAAAINKPDKSYRSIISNSVLEHIAGIDAVLREARRLLMDDGRFLVTVPTDQFERFTVGHELLSLCGLNTMAVRYRTGFNAFWKHYHCHDAKGWRAVFNACGWEMVSYQEYNSKRDCLRNDALVPLSFGSFLARRLCSRWFFVPAWRRVYGPALARAFKSPFNEPLNGARGGLVFIELKKLP